MVIFWVVAGVISAAATGLILYRAAAAARTPEPADPAINLFRRQLEEIDDLAGRGLLPQSERKLAHAEAVRRLLGEAERQGEAWSHAPAPKLVLALAVVAPIAALALYMGLGSPDLPDQPYAARMKAWRASDPRTLAPAEMAAVVGELAAAKPNDPEGYRYLALAEAAADNPAGAVRALRKAVSLAPNRADLWEQLGEALVMSDGGEVKAPAKAAFAEALKRDPRAMAARFQLARAQIADGDREDGLAALRALSAELPADDPHQPVLKATIARAEGRADTEAVGMDAIRGMVESLAARLQANPDDPEGWLRLVRSYAVLGDTEKRDSTLKAAQVRYASDPKMLDQLKSAAAAEPLR